MGRPIAAAKTIPERLVDRRISRVLSRRNLAVPPATIIYLALPLLAGSSSLPESRNGPGRSCSLLGLASGGVCRASLSLGCWCALTLRAFAPHRFTLTGEVRNSECGVRNRGKSFFNSAFRTPRSALPRRFTFCCTVPPVGGGTRECPPLPGVGITHHRALRSPDFPPPDSRRAAIIPPTDQPNYQRTGSAAGSKGSHPHPLHKTIA